jgi:transcription antitermination protein NusB
MKRDASTSQRRRHAREMAVKILYEVETGSLTLEEAQARIRRKLRRAETRDLAVELVNQTLENIAKIDKIIGEVAENWDVSRMAALDRSILRLGTAEILYSDVPAKVAINEAIEIAKRYSTEDSGRFVNGILDKVARMKSEIRDNI